VRIKGVVKARKREGKKDFKLFTPEGRKTSGSRGKIGRNSRIDEY